MTAFDLDLATAHHRDLHHSAQSAARARRIRSARRWQRKARFAARRAGETDALVR